MVYVILQRFYMWLMVTFSSSQHRRCINLPFTEPFFCPLLRHQITDVTACDVTALCNRTHLGTRSTQVVHMCCWMRQLHCTTQHQGRRGREGGECRCVCVHVHACCAYSYYFTTKQVLQCHCPRDKLFFKHFRSKSYSTSSQSL